MRISGASERDRCLTKIDVGMQDERMIDHYNFDVMTSVGYMILKSAMSSGLNVELMARKEKCYE